MKFNHTKKLRDPMRVRCFQAAGNMEGIIPDSPRSPTGAGAGHVAIKSWKNNIGGDAWPGNYPQATIDAAVAR